MCSISSSPAVCFIFPISPSFYDSTVQVFNPFFIHAIPKTLQCYEDYLENSFKNCKKLDIGNNDESSLSIPMT